MIAALDWGRGAEGAVSESAWTRRARPGGQCLDFSLSAVSNE